MYNRRSAAWHEREFNKRWRDLTDYNTEVAHGLVHTPEWDAKMARKQDLYNNLTLINSGAIWTYDLDEIRNV